MREIRPLPRADYPLDPPIRAPRALDGRGVRAHAFIAMLLLIVIASLVAIGGFAVGVAARAGWWPL